MSQGRKSGTLFGAASCCMLAVALLAALLAPTAASASLGQPLVKFGSYGTGAGQLRIENGALAADPGTGHVFVAESHNDRLSEFTAWGEFVKAWGWGVDDGTAALQTCTKASGCQAGKFGAGSGQFDRPNGIALSPGGDLYVFERANRRVQVFDQSGEFLRMFGGGVNQTDGTDICTKADQESGDVCGIGSEGTGPSEFSNAPFTPYFKGYIDIAVDGTVYVGDTNRIEKFDEDGTYLGSLPLPEPGEPGALALDPVSGDVYFSTAWSQLSLGRVYRLDENTGALIYSLQPQVNAPEGIAVDPTGEVYVTDDPDIEKSSQPTTNPLLRELNPLGALVSSCCPSTSKEGERIFLPFIGTNVVTLAGGVDLYVGHYESGTQTAFVEARGPAPDKWPPPSVPPTIEAQYATVVGQTTATLQATINPNFWADSSYHLEYGTAPCSGGGCTKTAETSLGSGIVKEPIQAKAIELGALAPGTTYHYRFVAKSGGGGPVNGVEPGEKEGTFTTAKPQVKLEPCPNDAFRKGPGADLRDCRAYEMVSPVDKLGGDILVVGDSHETPSRLDQAAVDGNGVTYSSYRSFGDAESAGFTTQYLASRGASEWETHGISPPREGPSAIKVRGLDSQYKAFADDLSTGWLVHDTEPALAPKAVSGYQDLYRHELPAGAYETLSTKAPPVGTDPDSYNIELQAVSEDKSRAVLRVNAKLTNNAVSLTNVYQLYEVFKGTVKLVSVEPDGTAVSSGATAGALLSSLDNGREANSATAMSDDGSRIYWSSGAAGKAPLFVRLGGTQTKAVSAGNATFWAANPSGSEALYQEAGALKLYDLGEEASEVLAASGVVGVMGASDDLSRVYFVSKSELASGASVGELNLFLYESGQGLRYVTTLDDLDFTNVDRLSPIVVSPRIHLSRVSADGATLVFMSRAALTGADNIDLASGEADAELFRYRAASDQLSCVSCNPSGARAAGRNLEIDGFPSGYWFASKMPGWEFQLHAARVLSEDGNRVYFDSVSPLAAGDQNEALDVYQWQALNSGSCSATSDNYSAVNDGCISLISSGKDTEDSEFVDSAENGHDVFFLTRDSLVSWDPAQIDLYDAREGGGFAGPTPIADECEGESCQSPGTPPAPPANGSQGFVGPGNKSKLTCPKGYVKKKNHCVKKPKKHKKGKKHRGKSRGARR